MVLFDNSVDCRKAQASAFAHFFKGKKGIEYLAQGLFIHSDPRIRHRGDHLISPSFRSYGQCASFRHRIICVVEKIHEDLAEERAVPLYKESPFNVYLDIDVLIKNPAYDPIGLQKAIRKIHLHYLVFLVLAGELQDIVDQVYALFDRVKDIPRDFLDLPLPLADHLEILYG